MPLFRDLNLLYIHVPKTGGTSIKEYFKKFSSMDYCGVNAYSNDTIGNSDHYIPSRLKYEISNYNNLVKFVTFRNPYDRIVSEFFWLSADKYTSFDDFIVMVNEHIKNISWLDCINKHITIQFGDKRALEIEICHLLPQHYYYDSNLEILKFETLDDDFNQFLLRHNLPKSGKLMKFNTTKHNNYKDYFDREEIRDIIYNIYKKDFQLLNYPINLD